MTDKPRRAAIYARISLDKTDDELGVTRQKDEARELCEKREYDVREAPFVDNSISALNGKLRPRYAALLAAVERGEIDVIVVYHLSRIWRNRQERAAGIEIFKRHRVSIATVKGPELDLSTAAGRGMAGIIGEFDTMESETKSERQRSQMKQAADAGKPHTGGSRCFGYARTYDVEYGEDGKPKRVVKDVVHDDEAAVIRECARRLLAGESLASVTRDIDARGIETVAGKRWTPSKLRKLMCSARISGRREHTPDDSWRERGPRPVFGEIAGKGNWQEIISVEDSDRLRTLLTNPNRRTSPREARKTMLTGILTCAACGRGMVSRPRSGEPRYVCTGAPGSGSCGRMAVNGLKADERVRDIVIAALDGPELTDRLRRRCEDSPDLTAQIREDEKELELLAGDLGAKRISRPEWIAARVPIVARLEAARTRMARETRTTALDGFTGSAEYMRARWEAMNAAQRRAVVTSVIESIVVNKPETSNRFDPKRFAVKWRDGE